MSDEKQTAGDKLKEFRKLVYEPDHERGITCWCKPKAFRLESGLMQVVHNEQRDVLSEFVRQNFYERE